MSLGKPTLPNQRHRPLHVQLFAGAHPFYTSGDRVEGLVRVAPSTRPVQVSIRFRGFSLVYDTNGFSIIPDIHVKGTKIDLLSYSQDLFVSTGAGENFDILRRGTADDGKVELPFSFIFPQTVSLAPPSDRIWWYSKDPYNHPRFQHSPGFHFPPSSSPPFNGPLAPKIVYYLEAYAETTMPDTLHMTVHQELKFLPPAPDYHPALLHPDPNFGLRLPKHYCQYKFIRTRKLLPGYGESSKLGKMKDILVDKELFFGLSSFCEGPFARFNLFATPACVLVIGSRIPVIITVQHLDRSKSLPDPPDLFMRRLRVQLLSTFSTFVPSPAKARHDTKEVVHVAKDTITLFDKKFDGGDGEPLFSGLDLQEVGDLTMSHEKLLPSFTSYGLCLEHELQVEIWGECVKHEWMGIACRAQVQVVSGWNAIPGPQEDDVILDEDSRPAYQELDPLLSTPELSTVGRPHELIIGGAVQELGATTLAYENLRPTAQQSNSRAVPPPPYVG